MKITFFLTIFFFANFANAQNLHSDRSSFSYTPFTLNKKGFQTEIGYSKYITKGYEKPYKDMVFLTPQTIFKYGIINNFELQTGFDFRRTKNIVGNGTFVTKPDLFLMLGFKYNFIKQNKIIPTTSLLVHLINPTDLNFKYGIDTVLDYKIRLLFENKISNVFSLNYSLGLEQINDYNPLNRSVFTITPTAVFNEKWRMFLDLHNYIYLKSKSFINYVGFGIQYTINNRLRFDINYGLRYGNEPSVYFAADTYYGTGLSYKFK